MEITPETRQVTLKKGEETLTGMPDVGFSVIKWENGSKWSKQVAGKDVELEQPSLLSERQKNIVIDRINASMDIWGLSESVERSIIETPVTMVNDKLKECLISFMLEDWKTAIAILLNDTLGPDQKKEELQGIF